MKGFTLIELIIVIIIIGILAAISVPMMQNFKAKAIVSEAVMGLSAMRTAMRQYYIENPGVVVSFSPPDTCPPGINQGDLSGTYFNERCYVGMIYYPSNVLHIDSNCDFFLNNNGDKKTPKYQEANSIADDLSHAYLKMDKDGNITGSRLSRAGYP